MCEKHSCILKAYIFLWRSILVRPILKSFGLSYHFVCEKLLSLAGINDNEKSFILSRSLFHGIKLSFDITKTTQRIMYFNYVYEPKIVNLYKRVLKQGQGVVDVGAHIGYFTFLAVNLVGEKGHVFAFEPHPSNFEILNQNIKNNKISNIITEKCALSDKEGYEQFYYHPLNEGGGKLGKINECLSSSITVHTTRFDNFYYTKIHNINIDFIKIDVEGSELKVLLGMKNIIGLKHPFILVEFLERIPRLEIIVFLKKYGYKHFIDITKYDMFCAVNLGEVNVKNYRSTLLESLKMKFFN